MSARLFNSYHGGRLGEFINRYELNSRDILDFSVNINPYGPSPKAKQAIKAAINTIASYPDTNILQLKETLAVYSGVRSENIIVDNGSVSLIYLIISVYRPKNVVVIAPTFTEYERAARIYGSKVKNIFPTNGRLDDNCIDHLKEAELVFLCNPNNPTATLYGASFLAQLRQSTPEALLIIDESFMDFIENENNISWVQKAALSERLIVLRSLSKFFALAGLRLGYLVTNEKTVSYLALRQTPWPVNNLAAAAVGASLNDNDYIKRSRSGIMRLRNNLFIKLREIDSLEVYPSKANFFLIKIINPRFNALLLQDKLAKSKIFFRLAADFPGLDKRYFRVSVRGEADNGYLVEKLCEAVE